MRKTDERARLCELFAGALNQDKPRVTEELPMGAFGLAREPRRQRSHLRPGPKRWVVLVTWARLLRVEIHFHRLMLSLLSANITGLFAKDFHLIFRARLDIAYIYLK